MPVVDAPYIIGSIRHQERSLLQADEYTRLLAASDLAGMVAVLRDTPYGVALSQETAAVSAATVLPALQQRLRAVQAWLQDLLGDSTTAITPVLPFIQARYDGLNAATVILAWKAGADAPGELSPLGSIAPTTWHTLLWHMDHVAAEAEQPQAGDVATAPVWNEVPRHWQTWLQTHLAMWQGPVHHEQSTHSQDILLAVVDQVMAVQNKLAKTPLMKWYVTWLADTQQADEMWRQQVAAASSPDISGYALEQQADAQLVEKIREYKVEPTSSDAILAWWLAIELEVKTLRLLISAKVQHMPLETITALQRPLYAS